MTKNGIISTVSEALYLNPPDWVPDEYLPHVNFYVENFIKKNQMPIRGSDNLLLYPINRDMVYNRVANQLMKALMDGVEVPETNSGVEALLTKNPKYPIMLNGREERALCKAVQDSSKIANPSHTESTRDYLATIAITFLSPRIKVVYRKFEKAINAYDAYEDVIQEMMLAMLKMLEEFNFEITTAGLTKDYVNGRLFKAINLALSASRRSDMAQETWNKVIRFVNTPEDHQLSRSEIKKKYHCSSGLVDVMFTFVGSGGLEVSIDQSISDSKKSLNDSKSCTIGDLLPAKDQSEAELNIDMTLKKILTEQQYEVVKLKLRGYSHQAIAEVLGFDSKRKSQYLFICARNAIEKEYEVDTSKYSKGQNKIKRQERKKKLQNSKEEKEFTSFNPKEIEDDIDDDKENADGFAPEAEVEEFY